MTIQCTAGEESRGERIDKYLSEQYPDLSRSFIQKLLKSEAVTIKNRPVKSNYKLSGGEEITLCIPDAVEPEILAEPMELDIIYEDRDIILINKPKGMVVHPGAGQEEDSLASALLARYGWEGLSDVGGPLPPLASRPTGWTETPAVCCWWQRPIGPTKYWPSRFGRTVFCAAMRRCCTVGSKGPIWCWKTSWAATLSSARRWRWWPRAGGRPEPSSGVLGADMGPYTHVKLELFTGRTHQIRVQTAQIGHPVCGDPLYGPKHPEKGLQGQCLHARTIGFLHPESGRYLEFTSDLPPYFTAFLQALTTRYGGIYE